MNESALEPQLTKFDLRVLNALAEWPEDLGDTLIRKRLEFRSAWVVAERIREYDVRLVRDTLRGLVRFGYAENREWGEREEWIKSWRWPEIRPAAFNEPEPASPAASGEKRPSPAR